MLPPATEVGELAPGIDHFQKKVQGIRTDDQSLSPVTPLVYLLFCHSYSLEMFRDILKPFNKSDI